MSSVYLLQRCGSTLIFRIIDKEYAFLNSLRTLDEPPSAIQFGGSLTVQDDPASNKKRS